MTNKHFIGILNPHDTYYNGYTVTEFELSKDGAKVRYKNNDELCYTKLKTGRVFRDFKSFEEDFKKIYGETKYGYWGICEKNGKYEVLTGIDMKDDDFDDIVHIWSSEDYQLRFVVEITGSKADVVDGTKITVYFNSAFNIFLFTNIDSAISFLEKKFTDDGFNNFDQKLKEKFYKWLKEYGLASWNEIWKDFNGTTEQTEWAINNNIDPSDFDTWQAVQRVLRHTLSYDKAMKIDKVLNEINLSIFDCE